MKAILVIGRTVEHRASLEVRKTSSDYFENVAVIEMSESDMNNIGVKEGKNVEISSSSGSTVAKCRKSNIENGIVFMPHGPWACMVLNGDTHGTGMPDLKGIPVDVSATDKNIPTVKEILKIMKEGKQ